MILLKWLINIKSRKQLLIMSFLFKNSNIKKGGDLEKIT